MDFWDFQESQDGSDVINCMDSPEPASAPPEEIQSVIRRFCYFSKHKNVGREYRNPDWLIPSGRTTSRSTIWTNRVIVCRSVLSRESTTWRGHDWEPSLYVSEGVRVSKTPCRYCTNELYATCDQSFGLRVTAPHQNPYFLFQNPPADELFCIIFVKT